MKNGQDIFINFREKASQKATTTMYLDAKGKVIPQLSTSGYLAVAIPGTVAGLDMALTQYGTMTRAKVMAPAIQLAEEGFILQQGDVDILNQGKKNLRLSLTLLLFS
jgi:gamma-glutamyltranspeptidase/glutathione hydrolase